jgi:SSS family solute:Na+ symporter
VLCVIYSVDAVGGLAQVLELFPLTGRTLAEVTGEPPSFAGFQVVDFAGHGFGDGNSYAFWPMLVGGLFLYVSYYGCDQTQVQRELSSKNLDDTNLSLMLNGLLRFPLVLTYCFMGVCIGAYAVSQPSFLQELRTSSGYEYNLAVPKFVLGHLPHGVIGLVIVALFAAAMSSLDSTINSLSATTMKDLYERFLLPPGETLAPRRQLWLSRSFTVFWGMVCVGFSFVVGNISNSVIESVNLISSLVNGPILALFLLGILTRRANAYGAVTGLLAGFFCDLALWAWAPQVSWLWWNLIGFAVAFGVGYLVSLAGPPPSRSLDGLIYEPGLRDRMGYQIHWPPRYALLGLYTLAMIAICLGIGNLG